MTPRAVAPGRPPRVVWLLLVVAMIALGAVGVAQAKTSEDARALAALQSGAAYVDPSAFSPQIAEQIRTDAAQLIKRGDDIKLVAVSSTGGQNIYEYAAELRTALRYTGTLVVTTPTGALGAAGPRSASSIQNALLVVGADQVSNPAARLLVAAEVSTPPPSDTSNGIRDLVLLVGLALLGGAFAIGWGLRREERRVRDRAMEVRGVLTVYADALGVRAALLAARRGQTIEARALVEAVDAYHLAAAALVDHAMTEAELAEGAASLRSGLLDAEQAGVLLGLELPAAQPFDGLCSVDPAHGPLAHTGQDRLLCAACVDRLRAGHELVPRRVLIGGLPVPYRDAPVPYEITTPLAGART